MIRKIMGKLTNKQDLTAEEIYSLIAAIRNDELSEVQIAGFQVALLMKGPTLQEITAIAQAMRDNCIRIYPLTDEELMDTCGTGGGLSTFNISTAVAFVAAAAGIPVAKHGSSSITSLSGSADVMAALGVEINQSPSSAQRLIEDIGIAFLYAPLFHPVMNKVIPREKDLGIRTIFYTIIGPLINPTKASRHMMGVYRKELLGTVTEVAASIGYRRALFVHGTDGLDEISMIGSTIISELDNGVMARYEIKPEDFGIDRCSISDLATGTPQENARMIRDVFSRRDRGPRRDAVVLNSAGALIIGGRADSFIEGIKLANDLIDSGEAEKKLKQLIEASHDYAQSVRPA